MALGQAGFRLVAQQVHQAAQQVGTAPSPMISPTAGTLFGGTKVAQYGSAAQAAIPGGTIMTEAAPGPWGPPAVGPVAVPGPVLDMMTDDAAQQAAEQEASKPTVAGLPGGIGGLLVIGLAIGLLYGAVKKPRTRRRR